MGTFRIITPTLVGSKTVQKTHNDGTLGTSDADLIAGLISTDSSIAVLGCGADINSNTAVDGVIRFDFDQSSAIISLDGNPAISFNSLPAGFTPLSAVLSVLADGTEAAGVFGTSLFLQLDTFTESGQFNPSNIISIAATLAYNFSILPKPTILDIINNGFGFRWAFHAIPNTPNPDLPANNQFGDIYNYSFTGTYTIQQSSFTPILQNPTVPVRVGDKVKIISSAGGLDEVKQVQLTYNDPVTGLPQVITLNIDSQDPSITVDGVTIYGLNFIILQQPDFFWFYLPWQLGSFAGDLTITLIGDGTQFSGSVALGSLNILYEDASGIYSLASNQTNDILYFRDGYTTDIKMLMLPSMLEDDESYRIDEDFFSLLPYPKKILSQSDVLDDVDDFEDNNLLITSVTRSVVVTEEIEIPSPFVRTAFLP
jgi:hypothetical protein